MRIGIIGSGMIGGTVGKLWAKAGHEVLFSSRHPEKLADLARAAGGRAGTVEEAARFGEVVFLAVPYKALPELHQQIGEHLRGKTVIDAGNLYPDRDGAVAQSVLDEGVGAGVGTQRHLPEAHVVRGFNTVYFKVLEKEAHRKGDGVGIPLAGDDKAALDTAAKLVRDAGFDPVIVGGLSEARRFDAGTPVYNTGKSGPEVRAALGV